MAPTGNDEVLIGIKMASEAYSRNTDHDVSLGVVSSCNMNTLPISALRQEITSQLKSVPAEYSFLSKQGWPITHSQEQYIKLKEVLSDDTVVRLQKSYEKPRVGVRTNDGTAIGFVFVDYTSSASSLRHIIEEQLGTISQKEGSNYQFVDRNGWPVMREQENSLAVLDLLHNSTVILRPVQLLTPSIDSLDGNLALQPLWLGASAPKKARLGVKQLTFQSSKDEVRLESEDSRESSKPGKQFLISYVRAEAAQHALDLKRYLTDRGLSVYLDVHEIKSGFDWQDSLNFAVSNCQAFVPLITPRYGETLWTNREVKLADVLSKLIIPVSFLDTWPPRCLAIQFATTQYIPWHCENQKHEEEEGTSSKPVSRSSSVDVTVWPEEDIKIVAEKIEQRLHAEQQKNDFLPRSQLMKRPSMLRSCPFSLPDEYSACSQHREGRPLVVISVHPAQRAFGEKLRELFEEECFEGWCSSDLVMPEPACPDTCASDDDALFSQESVDKTPPADVCLNQFSQLTMSQSTDETGDPKLKRDIRLRFQEKADEAGVIVFVLSEAFANSKTSKMQVFYCEHRKRVVLLKYEEFAMPCWMSMLIGTGVFEDVSVDGYQESLKTRVRRAVENEEAGDDITELTDISLSIHAQQLLSQVPSSCYVYISGGTKFYNQDSEAICVAIGESLASLDDIGIVTGGFYGVGEVLSRAYERRCLALHRAPRLWHILPVADEKDRRARRNEEKTFQKVPYGQTVFVGNSVRERESIVARAFDLCLLVEGGPGAAHEAQQFSWNDRVVIPIKSTGGAAAGLFKVPEKIFEVPCGVSKRDWARLSDRHCKAAEVGDAVLRIVSVIKKRLAMDVSPPPGLSSSQRQRQRQGCNSEGPNAHVTTSEDETSDDVSVLASCSTGDAARDAAREKKGSPTIERETQVDHVTQMGGRSVRMSPRKRKLSARGLRDRASAEERN